MNQNEFHRDRTLKTFRGLLVAVLATSALTASAQGQGIALRNGVVVDAARSIAYVMHPQGGIQALDLERGTALWRSAQGERPLALVGDLLVAQGQPGESGELRIVALDVRQNGRQSSEADLAMPAGIRAQVADTLRQSFRVTASPSPDGIVVSWEAQVRPALAERMNEGPAGGRVGPAAAASRSGGLEGIALFDVHAGSLMPVAAADVRLARSAAAASLSSPVSAERRFASVDGRHVLASLRTGGAASPAPYRWTISEAATGAVLGTFPSAVSMAPFAVLGTRLVHVAQASNRREGSQWTERPLRLRAVDLASGRELWSWEIRDTEFRGPFPL
jgi:hypothetical protein